MLKTRLTLAAIAAALLLGSFAASAATYERTYYLDTSLGGPQSGYNWAIEQFPIENFTPSPGDTLILHIQFDRPLLVEDLGIGENIETIFVSLDTGATTGGGVDAISNGTFSFPDATGDLLNPTLSWATQGGGWGIGALRYINITNGAFTFSKLDVTWNLSSVNFYPPSDRFQYIWVSLSSDRVTVVPDPINPAALIANLLDDVTGVGPGTSLADKVTLAQTYYAVPDIASTCSMLGDFKSQVNAQSGKKLQEAFAVELLEDATEIMLAIECE